MAEYILKGELIEHLDKCVNEPIYDPDMSFICNTIRKYIENMKTVTIIPDRLDGDN